MHSTPDSEGELRQASSPKPRRCSLREQNNQWPTRLRPTIWFGSKAWQRCGVRKSVSQDTTLAIALFASGQHLFEADILGFEHEYGGRHPVRSCSNLLVIGSKLGGF